MSDQGLVIVAGHKFEVEQVLLEDGAFIVIAGITGPVPEIREEPVTIIGRDGRGICQGSGFRLSIPPVPGGGRVTVTVRLGVSMCT